MENENHYKITCPDCGHYGYHRLVQQVLLVWSNSDKAYIPRGRNILHCGNCGKELTSSESSTQEAVEESGPYR